MLLPSPFGEGLGVRLFSLPLGGAGGGPYYFISMVSPTQAFGCWIFSNAVMVAAISTT